MDGRTNWYYAMCGKNNMWGLQYVKKRWLLQFPRFYICLSGYVCWIKLIIVCAMCMCRAIKDFYCVTWCFVQQRAAVVFIGRHSNTCTNLRVTTVWWLFWRTHGRKNDGNLPSKNVRNGRMDELLCVVKNNGGAYCCLSLGIWRYIAFYLVNYDIALISFANTTIPCSVLISLLDVKGLTWCDTVRLIAIPIW